jgi:nitroreductase
LLKREARRVRLYLWLFHRRVGGPHHECRAAGGDGPESRLPVEQIFFDASFDRPAAPPETLAPLIEAARHAPSALNVQPWRFLWHKEQLTLFVQKANPKYGSGEKQAYSFFDGGLCMANLSLAMQALKMSGQWVLLDEAEADLPSYPETLLPIARLQLER